MTRLIDRKVGEKWIWEPGKKSNNHHGRGRRVKGRKMHRAQREAEAHKKVEEEM